MIEAICLMGRPFNAGKSLVKFVEYHEGIPILIVTHENDIASYAGRRIFIKDGKLRSDERQAARKGDRSVEAG